MKKYTVQELRTAYDKAKAAGDERSASYLLEQADQAVDESTAGIAGDPKQSVISDSSLENFRAGIGGGMVNTTRNVANLVGLGGEKSVGEAIVDKQLGDTKAGKAGQITGEVALSAPLGMGASAGASRALPALGRLLTNPVARGAFEGAVTGYATGEDGQRGQRAVLGTAFGAALPLGLQGAGKLVRGVTRTPEAQRLLDQGVDLTPGQLNPKGMLNQLEESWQSVPLVGSVIRGARENAGSTFQRAAANQGSVPGTAIAQGDAKQMLREAYDSFQPLYSQAKGFPVRTVIKTPGQPDIDVGDELLKAVANRGVRATDQQRKGVMEFLESQSTKRIRNSDDLLEIRSKVRAEAREAAQTQGDEASARLLEDVDSVLTRSIESQLPAQARTALRTADSKYVDYKMLEQAVGRAKGKPGGFTATDLDNAVASNAPAGGGYARGAGGPMRELAEDGRRAFEVRAPATGARLAALGIPVALGASNPVGLAAGAGLLGMIGTRTGRRLASGSTAPQQAGQRLLGHVNKALPVPARQTIAALIQRAAAAGLIPQGQERKR